MGKIRSAWEIALEKTENMEIDQDKIRHSQDVDKIRRIAGQYITAEEAEADEAKLADALSAFDPALLREALESTVLNSLSLPQDEEVFLTKTKRISTLISIAFPSEDLLSFYGQVTEQLSQYPAHREDLLKRLKEQLEPMLKQKEEAMRQKYGESVHLTVENDKESMETVKNYLERLNKQYDDTLVNAKATLKELLSQVRG